MKHVTCKFKVWMRTQNHTHTHIHTTQRDEERILPVVVSGEVVVLEVISPVWGRSCTTVSVWKLLPEIVIGFRKHHLHVYRFCRCSKLKPSNVSIAHILSQRSIAHTLWHTKAHTLWHTTRRTIRKTWIQSAFAKTLLVRRRWLACVTLSVWLAWIQRNTHTYTQIKDKTTCSSVWRGCCGRGHFACVRWSMQDRKRLNDMIQIRHENDKTRLDTSYAQNGNVW